MCLDLLRCAEAVDCHENVRLFDRLIKQLVARLSRKVVKANKSKVERQHKLTYIV